jgi:hypothetical protein
MAPGRVFARATKTMTTTPDCQGPELREAPSIEPSHRASLRLLFLAGLFLAVGLWRAGASGLGIWSSSQRNGGVRAVLPVGRGWVAASTYANRLFFASDTKISAVPYHRPLQLFSDRHGGTYVLGLLGHRLDHLGPSGSWQDAVVFPEKVFVTTALAEPNTLWVVWYARKPVKQAEKTAFYMPELATFHWCIQKVRQDRIVGEFTPGLVPFACFNAEWHEETAGIWRLLASENRLFVINDEAETVTSLDKWDGHILWEASTEHRPTGGVIWNDRLVVSSAHAGTVEAYDLSNGKRLWPEPRLIGRGLTDVALVGDEIAATDFVHNRVLFIDPLQGTVARDMPVAGSPRALAPTDGKLLVGFDAVAELVQFNHEGHQDNTWFLPTESDP